MGQRVRETRLSERFVGQIPSINREPFDMGKRWKGYSVADSPPN